MPDKQARQWPILSVPMGFVILVALACIGGYGAFSVAFIEDVTALLPSKEKEDSSYVEMAREWGFMQKVAVVVGPGEPSSDKLHGIIDELAVKIAAINGVRRVTSTMDMESVRRAAQFVAAGAPRLVRSAPAAMDEKEIQKRLVELKKRLASAEAMVMQDILLADPLGFSRDALKELESAGEAMGATVDREHIVSRDKRYALVIVDIAFDPFEVSAAKRFVVDLDRVVNKTLFAPDGDALRATVLGGVYYTASSADVVSKDIVQAFILTSGCVILIFFLFFRRIRMLLVALVPGGAGIAVAIGFMALIGEQLHALTLGFAATITGISVDYVIHLLHRAIHEKEADSKTRMAVAGRTVARPVVLGCVTTVGAFVLVATSNFVALRQLALFAAVSVPVAMLVTLFVVPSFHGFLLGGLATGGTASRAFNRLLRGLYGATALARWRFVVIALFICLTAIALSKGLGVPMSGDPRDLGYVDGDLEKKSGVLRDLFPGFSDQALVVASGATYERALQANDALYDALRGRGFGRTEVISISPFLPSLKTQSRAVAAVQEVVGGARGKRTAELFEQAGFKASYFARVADPTMVEPIVPTTYAHSSLGQVVEDALKTDGTRLFVLTRVRAGDDATIDRLAGIVKTVAGCKLVSERLETLKVLSVLQREIVWMLAVWIGAALIMLSLSERSLWFGLRSTVPALFGVSLVVFLFALLDRPLTPVASAGITLVMGLGIDYGIFMQTKRSDALSDTASAVFASALTTVAGFGVLALSRVQAMADLGLIILVGVLGALVAALLLIPALSPKASDKELAS
jgi:predicted exporter